jgi:transcriptional regulator with XRE-family HTH domain
MESIGNRIGRLRRQANMTQEALAEKLGISSQAVSKWENDLSCPDISLLAELSRILGTTADELLTGNCNEVRVVPAGQRKNIDELVVRIKVNSKGGDRVRVNLPVGLIRALSSIGLIVTGPLGNNDVLKNIDWEKIQQLVENGIIGKIVEVESADGDTVEIVVE